MDTVRLYNWATGVLSRWGVPIPSATSWESAVRTLIDNEEKVYYIYNHLLAIAEARGGRVPKAWADSYEVCRTNWYFAAKATREGFIAAGAGEASRIPQPIKPPMFPIRLVEYPVASGAVGGCRSCGCGNCGGSSFGGVAVPFNHSAQLQAIRPGTVGALGLAPAAAAVVPAYIWGSVVAALVVGGVVAVLVWRYYASRDVQAVTAVAARQSEIMAGAMSFMEHCYDNAPNSTERMACLRVPAEVGASLPSTGDIIPEALRGGSMLGYVAAAGLAAVAYFWIKGKLHGYRRGRAVREVYDDED